MGIRKSCESISASQSVALKGILVPMATDTSTSLSRFTQRAMVVFIHLLVLIVPFIFTWVNEELFEFPKMLLTYGIVTIIGGFWVARMILEQRIIFRRTVFDLPLALFVISQLASTVFSIHPYTSFFGYYTRFHGGLLSTLTYVTLFYAAVSNLKKTQIRALLVTTLVAAAGVCLYAIPEHFGRSPSCYLISSGQTFDVACWIQDVRNRVFGTFGQPNWLAAYTVILLPVALSLAVGLVLPRTETDKESRSQKHMALAAVSLVVVALLFVTLLFTQSKSGLAGLAGALGIWVGLTGWHLFRFRSVDTNVFTSHLKTIVVVGLISALSLGGLSLMIGPPFAPNIKELFFSRLTTSFNQPENLGTKLAENEATPVVNRLDIGGTDSGEIRRIVWSGAWNVFKRYPILGSGVETFAYSYYQDRPMAHNLVSEWDFLYNKAHNEFLNYLSTTGAVGLITYSLLLGWPAIVVLRMISNRKSTLTASDHYLAIGLLAGVVGLSISNFFGFSTVMVTILMYLAMAIVVILESPSVEEKLNVPAPTGLQSFSLAGVGVSVLYLVWMIYTAWSADYAYTLGKQYIQAGYTLEGLQNLQSATTQSPNEALFFDELSATYSLVAANFQQQGDATSAAEFTRMAMEASDTTLALNSRHLNFLKTRVRVFINLTVVEPTNFLKAESTLIDAISLAPTDAKLRYNLALIEAALEKRTQSANTLEETVRMKPNYEAARLELARYYRQEGRLDESREQYNYMLTNINSKNTVAIQELSDLNRQATASGTRTQ